MLERLKKLGTTEKTRGINITQMVESKESKEQQKRDLVKQKE
jgi:hypothetical protein